MKNKKTHRLFAIILVIAMLFTCMTGCHGSKGQESFQVPEAFDETRDYEIVFWAKNDTNKAQIAIYDQAVADFQAVYPNIHVNIRYYTDYSRIYNDVITNISTNTTPNVCITYPDHIATYLTGSNTVVALDELFDDAKYGLGGSEVRFDSPKKEEIVAEFLEECAFDGSYYAIPYMRSTEACYVNKTYVEALGYTLPEILTWDFVWEVSEAALAQNEDGTYKLNGQNVMIPFIYKSTDNMMITYLWQQNAGYSTDDGEILIFNDTTEDFLKTVQTHAETGAFSTFKISSYPANFLNAGQCIFAVDSTAGATWMGTDAPNLDIAEDQVVEFETVLMEIPQADPSDPAMISQGPSVCIFNKEDPQEVLASWLFAQFLLTNEVQIAYSETEGYVPVTEKAQKDAAYQEYLSLSGTDNNEHYSIKIDAAKLLMDHTANTFTTPVFNGSASLRNAAGQMIENVTKSARRGETIDDAYMKKLYSDITSLYRLDQEQSSGVGKTDLGPLPSTSVALLVILAVTWVILGTCWLVQKKRDKGAGKER